MAREFRPIDVSHIPELLRIAEEVGASGEARVLRGKDKDLAVIMPTRARTGRRARKPKTQEDIDAFLSAAGSWKDVDTDKLVRDTYESRRSSRPPVDL